ncbi:MAG TPA: glycoside hydrolase family 2 TIM barrel-domain containing protein [Pedobacter sp.]
MKNYSLCLLLLFIHFLQGKAQTAAAGSRPVTINSVHSPGTSSVINSSSVINFNQNWEFIKDTDTTLSRQSLSSATVHTVSWEKISLPHTPRIEPVQKVTEQWQGTCFYRKFFSIAAADQDKHIAVRFDAAMHQADIYLNGKHLYTHTGGYLPFTVDLSGFIRYGQQNCILVKLNNQDNAVIPPGKPIKDLDFNYYGGIYRNTWLIIKDKLAINDAVQENREAGGGLLVYSEEAGPATARLTVKADISNHYSGDKKAVVKIILSDDKDKVVFTSVSDEQSIQAGEFKTFKQNILVNAPELWSPSHPYLYQLKVQVLQNGKITDEQNLKTGIKTIRFEAGGFYLNGQKLNIVGTNRHQEYPYIGYALSDQAQFRDAWKIKEAGFNFVRCSHYPPSPAFLDACDQLGIMVMDAIPGWQFFGNAEFRQNSFQNIRDMIHRDRNHASIVLWEASLNETEMSKDYMDTAHQIVHRALPFTGVFTTGWMDYAYDVFNPARQHAKAPDYWKKYNRNKPLLIAEYGDWEYYAQNAGFNQKAYSGLKSEERNSRQLRTDGQQRLLQQALNFKEAHNDDLGGPGIGDVNWLMFDYKRGYAADLESSGIMDIFRLPKFSYYFYQSQYGPVKDPNGFGKPMLFIANYWNDAKEKTVRIFSNCDEVELFLNGRSLGKQRPDTDEPAKNLLHPPFTFHPAVYIPGKLTAVGYINGEKTITHTVSTPGKAFKVVLKADLSGKKLVAGKNDMIFVYACVTDKDGTVIPDAGNRISFSVQGQGHLIGGTTVKAEAGVAPVLLKSGDHAGRIRIRAFAAGLSSAELVYNTQ